MEVSGDGRKGVLVVGEAPGRTEDREGRPFVGQAGQVLREALEKIGVDLERDCWVTNAIVCRPPKNRTPTDREIQWCAPLLFGAIKRLQPRVILLLGGTAVRAVIGRVWGRDDVGAITRWVGWQIPDSTLNAWICPTYHPSYLLRQRDDAALALWFSRHLEAAFSLRDRPWPNGPVNWAGGVQVVMEPTKAARWLDAVRSKGGVIAWDLETNSIKPDWDDCRILSCAVCWRGKRTIAFPWAEPAISKMKELLVSKQVRKVGANIKYEHRWIRRLLGVEVRRWVWDTQLAAHFLSSRHGVTSLKFQSYVLLGVPAYETEVSGFMTPVGRGHTNRLHQAPVRELLKYNGLDALLTYHVAKKQIEVCGFGPRL